MKVEQQNDDKKKLTDELKCEVITPIFSYGANNSINAFSELRPTSLKGLMRNTFRIVQQKVIGEKENETENLMDLENQLFGDAKEYASPLRLAFLFDREKLRKGQRKINFLFHDKAKSNQNPNRFYIFPGSKFEVRIGRRQYKNDDKPEITKDLDWYRKLIELSLILGGLGQRSRKGRGRVFIKNSNQTVLKEGAMKKHIQCLLNEISLAEKPIYKLIGNKITTDSKKTNNRPVIEEIEFGKLIPKTNDWEQSFLENIDNASHEIQKKWGEKKFTTGSSNQRFASSVMVGVAKVEKGFLPIYTYITPISNGRYEKKINGKGEREEFVELIKNDLGGDVNE